MAGGGLAELRAAGVEVQTGVLENEARKLNAPYLKLLSAGRPWIVAKWAMTLDGKIAARTGDSRWISSPASRQLVHQLRGRMDAIIVGRGTAAADDPLLTARPPGTARTALRIVVDTRASLSLGKPLGSHRAGSAGAGGRRPRGGKCRLRPSSGGRMRGPGLRRADTAGPAGIVVRRTGTAAA